MNKNKKKNTTKTPLTGAELKVINKHLSRVIAVLRRKLNNQNVR